MLGFFCHFFEKKWRKKLPKGRFLAHTSGSTIESTMFAQTKTDNFLLRFFLKKRMGFGAKPHYLRVFFLLAFSFALAVSKEKAECEVRFCQGFRSLFEKSSAKTFIRESFREFSKCARPLKAKPHSTTCKDRRPLSEKQQIMLFINQLSKVSHKFASLV